MSFDEQPPSELDIAYQQYDKLLKLVRTMRNCQKEYFRTRSHEALIASKNAEKSVDMAIEKATGTGKQETMFGDKS